MRKRESIEKDILLEPEYKDSVQINQALMIEILLDIRELAEPKDSLPSLSKED